MVIFSSWIGINEWYSRVLTSGTIFLLTVPQQQSCNTFIWDDQEINGLFWCLSTPTFGCLFSFIFLSYSIFSFLFYILFSDSRFEFLIVNIYSLRLVLEWLFIWSSIPSWSIRQVKIWDFPGLLLLKIWHSVAGVYWLA